MRRMGAALAGLLMAGASLGTAQAAVSNLRTVEIGAGVVPSGFGSSHVAYYGHAVAALHVKARAENQMVVSTCAIPVGARAGMRAGLIQAFDRPAPGNALQVCAYQYGSSSAAHIAYTAIERQFRVRVTMHLASNVRETGLGNEAAGLYTAPGKCPCGTIEAGAYEVLFRHDNVVVDMTYVGKTQTFTMTKFAGMARGQNARLH